MLKCGEIIAFGISGLQIAGKLHIQISKLGGSFLERYGDTTNEDIEDTDPAVSRGTPMIVRVRLKSHCQQGYLLVLLINQIELFHKVNLFLPEMI